VRGSGKKKYWIMHTVLLITIIMGFVFASGCFEDLFGKPNNSEKTAMTDKQILKMGEEAIISHGGQKMSVTVDSFKEYKPRVDGENCLKLKWYHLQFKYTNVGDEEIRNPIPTRYSSYTLVKSSAFTLVDSKGNEVFDNDYCVEYPVETYNPHPPDEILSQGSTHYLTKKYLFSDNTSGPERMQSFTNIRDVRNGAVFHYKQLSCLDDRYDTHNCPYNNITEDDISWIVFP